MKLRLPFRLCLLAALVVLAAPALHAKGLTIQNPDFVLDPNGTSHVAQTFHEDDWHVVNGSVYHKGDDYYADDWNWGTGSDDLGKTVIAAAPGYVIYAGFTGVGQPFDGYGNQVVVHIVDQQGAYTEFAYRYAHLDSIAVGVGGYVHFGSEIGTVGSTGTGSPHLHSVLYENIYATASSSSRTGLENLQLGYSPSATLSGPSPSIFAGPFFNDGDPYFTNEEALPCSTWNFDAAGCDAHSIQWGGRVTQDCAYYACSGLCLPRGTSNCRAGCTSFCNAYGDDSDESLPCSTWNGDVQACDARKLQPGGTRDCAYYLSTDKCRPRGTSNCLAGISSYCS